MLTVYCQVSTVSIKTKNRSKFLERSVYLVSLVAREDDFHSQGFAEFFPNFDRAESASFVTFASSSTSLLLSLIARYGPLGDSSVNVRRLVILRSAILIRTVPQYPLLRSSLIQPITAFMMIFI